MRRALLVSLLLALDCATVLPSLCAGERWLRYEPSIVALQGTVLPRERFGPPSYGETPEIDTKEIAPILRLIETINVHGDPSSALNRETEQNVTEIHLVFPEGIEISQFFGREVTATGTLFHSYTGHHATRILMQVQSITPRIRDS